MNKDLTKFRGLHPRMIEAIHKTLASANEQNLRVGLYEGYRSPDRQEELYKIGRTTGELGKPVTNARAYESWHQLGLACDICFQTTKGSWTWDMPDESWVALGKIGLANGFEVWGGMWKNPDYPHFEIKGKFSTIWEAKVVLEEKGITEVWKLV